MEGQPLLESDQQDDLSIPSWDNLCAHYESRWAKEKEKFQNQLKMHFKALVERFACGTCAQCAVGCESPVSTASHLPFPPVYAANMYVQAVLVPP